MDLWTKCNITLRIRNASASKLVNEYSGDFDFSHYIPTLQLQYVTTCDLARFQEFMKKNTYDILVNENNIEVSLSENRNKKVDIDEAGNALCSTIAQFLVSYTSKAVLVPENTTRKYDEILQEIDHKNLACGVYMESGSNCYWLAGRNDDVIKAYRIFQEKVKELWFDIPSTGVETKLSPFNPSMNHNINEEFDIKFEIDTGADRRVIARGGTFRATEYLDMPVIQFMLARDINYFRYCMKTAGLSYKVKGQTLKVAIKSKTTCSDFDEIGVKLTNLIIHVSLLYANNLLKVEEKNVSDFSTKLNEFVTSKEGTLYADCFWRGDQTALWVVSRNEYIHDSYSMLNDVYQSCMSHPECAQSPVHSELLANETSTTDRENEMPESWTRMIEVHGATETITADAIEFHFDNKRRSGGGDVEDVKCEDGVTMVTFKTPDAVDRVVERKHTLSGVELHVKRHLPSEKIPKKTNVCKVCGKSTFEYFTHSNCGHIICNQCHMDYEYEDYCRQCISGSIMKKMFSKRSRQKQNYKLPYATVERDSSQ